MRLKQWVALGKKFFEPYMIVLNLVAFLLAFIFSFNMSPLLFLQSFLLSWSCHTPFTWYPALSWEPWKYLPRVGTCTVVGSRSCNTWDPPAVEPVAGWYWQCGKAVLFPSGPFLTLCFCLLTLWLFTEGLVCSWMAWCALVEGNRTKDLPFTLCVSAFDRMLNDALCYHLRKSKYY